MPTKSENWGGIRPWADSIYAHLHTRESFEAELRRRVEPFLSKAEKLIEAIERGENVTANNMDLVDARKELDTWK